MNQFRYIISRKQKPNIFSKSIKDILNSEIIFIAPDIETDSKGKSNYKKINTLMKLTLNKIKQDQIFGNSLTSFTWFYKKII